MKESKDHQPIIEETRGERLAHDYSLISSGIAERLMRDRILFTVDTVSRTQALFLEIPKKDMLVHLILTRTPDDSSTEAKYSYGVMAGRKIMPFDTDDHMIALHWKEFLQGLEVDVNLGEAAVINPTQPGL